jgi:hypothetical protein
LIGLQWCSIGELPHRAQDIVSRLSSLQQDAGLCDEKRFETGRLCPIDLLRDQLIIRVCIC